MLNTISNTKYGSCYCETVVFRRRNPLFQRGDCFAKNARNEIFRIAAIRSEAISGRKEAGNYEDVHSMFPQHPFTNCEALNMNLNGSARPEGGRSSRTNCYYNGFLFLVCNDLLPI